MKDFFGGNLLKGNPRKARSLSTKHPIHLVMKSSKVNRDRNLLKEARFYSNIARKLGLKHGIKIYSIRLENGQIQMILKIQSRRAYQRFIRAYSGMIVRLIFGIQRGPALRSKNTDQRKIIRFWDARPFTAIASWGPRFEKLKRFITSVSVIPVGFLIEDTKTLQRYPEDFTPKDDIHPQGISLFQKALV
jgi:hypothetical protein